MDGMHPIVRYVQEPLRGAVVLLKDRASEMNTSTIALAIYSMGCLAPRLIPVFTKALYWMRQLAVQWTSAQAHRFRATVQRLLQRALDVQLLK